MRPFYDRLYENIKTFEENPEKVMQVRSELAQEIVTASEGAPVLVTVGSPADGSREVSIYAEKGSEVTVNGQQAPITAEGAEHDQFSLVLSLDPGAQELDIVVSKDGSSKTVNRTLVVYETHAPYTVALNDAETDEAINRFTSQTVDTDLAKVNVTEGTYSMKAVFSANVNFPNLRLFDAGKDSAAATGRHSRRWSSTCSILARRYNSTSSSISWTGKAMIPSCSIFAQAAAKPLAFRFGR